MTTLVDDIKALMCLGFGLERATELAVADRNRPPAPALGNCLFRYFHRMYF